MNPLLRMHLVMLRAACVTVLTAIDLTLAEHSPTAQDSAPEEQRIFNSDSSKCGHPDSHLMAMPSMGHPNRIACRCGAIMEDSNGAQ